MIGGRVLFAVATAALALSPSDLRTGGPSDLRTLGPSDLRTVGPSHLGTLGPSDPGTLGPSHLGTLGPSDPQQHPMFTMRKEIVRIDVLVTEDGVPTHGLDASDFDVFDNGVRQQVELISADVTAIDAILAFDVSASVAGETLTQLQRAGHAVLSGLEDRDQAALVTFSQSISVAAPLSRDRARVGDAIDRIRASGETSLVDASYTSLVLGEADTNRGLAMIFSDGLDTSSWLPASAALDTARRSGTVVYAVSSSDAPRATFLRDLTSLTGGTFFEIDSARDLEALFLRVLNEFRQRYLLSYSPAGVSADGWHKLEVRVRNRPSAMIKARPGYQR